MYGQGLSYENRCCWCCPLRTTCIIIGIIEALVIPFQAVFFLNVVPNSEIHLFYVGMSISLIVVAPLIYGAIKRNCVILWPCAVINGIGAFAIPLIFFKIEIGRTTDPLGVGAICIYTTILIVLTSVQAFSAIVVLRYIHELHKFQKHEHKYDKANVPAGARSIHACV